MARVTMPVFGLAAFALASAAHAGEPRFDDAGNGLPVQHVYGGGWEHFVGGGAAVLDCDDNGYPDIYAAGGENPARLFRNMSSGGGDLAFDLVDAPELALTGVTGAYPLDIDGDGKLDLFVLRAGPNAVLRGLGGCRFERAEEAWHIDPGAGWSTAFAAAWGPGDKWPTLAVGNYVDRDDPNGPFGTCSRHQLFRPRDDGGYEAPETIAPGYCALSMMFTDWSGTGQADLWISNDRHYYVRDGQEQLFRIWPGLHAFGDGEGWQKQKLWGMGLASRDLDGDGRPEIAVTSMADQKLFTLDGTNGSAHFAAVAFARGMTAHIPYAGGDGRPSTGWHVQFGDVDNDGLDDLFISKGNVDQMPDAAMHDPDNLLMQQGDGRFVEAGMAAGIASFERGRGAALTDFNRDGLLDLVVVNRRAPLLLYRNRTPDAGNWIKLRLEQEGGNRNAVGARIELEAGGKRRFHEILAGGGHAGGQAGFDHFGLGMADAVRLRVRWPDGETSGWVDAAANAHYRVRRSGAGLSVSED